MERPAFKDLLRSLEEKHGIPAPPPTTDAFELILWEAVAYLADDAARSRAFAALKELVGTKPKQILKAPMARLVEITTLGGIMPEKRAERLREIAELAADGEFAVTRKALLKFPGIGEPGAEKILLFAANEPKLAMDSNALRVLLRLGFGEEKKSYGATYRSVQRNAMAEGPKDAPSLQRASLVLRRHGQALCRRADPLCEECPLVRECPFWRGERRPKGPY